MAFLQVDFNLNLNNNDYQYINVNLFGVIMLNSRNHHGKAFLGLLSFSLLVFSTNVFADEFGYVKGAETLPKAAMEVVQSVTRRADKGAGDYEAIDLSTKVEYGISDHFTVEGVLKLQSIYSSGLLINAYIPADIDTGFEYTGFELGAKYKFLNTAEHFVGLSTYWEFSMLTKDTHSGQDKETYNFEGGLLLQKYFMEGQLVWVSNFGVEATHAKRAPVDDLPEDYEWPTHPEMEIELNVGTAISYRFMDNWYSSLEGLYSEEHETEVGMERYSFFAGPSILYTSKKWWVALTYLKQIKGGSETFPEQDDFDLHLIEKTKTEVRLKVGLNY